jgi:hypothetical protein
MKIILFSFDQRSDQKRAIKYIEMKKLITAVFILISVVSFAQKKDLGIHMGCYSSGDTLTIAAVKKTSGINLFGEGSENFNLRQWKHGRNI